MKPFLLISSLLIASLALGQNPGGGQRRRRDPNQQPPTAAPQTPQPAPATDGSEPMTAANAEHLVTSQHSIELDGQTINYTATAGTLPIKNDDGQVEGKLFFVAYTKDGADVSTRPVTFAYNGGPGSSSMYLHMGCLGPRRAALNDDGSMPEPPFKVVDNKESWLDQTDVVMVDAMGTGYSRLAKPELGTKYYSMRGDIAAFGEFIREYLAKNHRFSSPVFLAGESYGGIRTSGLSNYLLQNGIAINGAIIISGVMNYGVLEAGRGNDAPYIGFLPSEAATAWYHHKLGNRFATVEDAVDAAEKFDAEEYPHALIEGSSMSPEEMKATAKKLSDLTGLSQQFVMDCHLRVNDDEFFKELLRDQGKTIGRYDSRFMGQDAREAGDSTDYDPSDAGFTPVFNSMVNNYLETELNYDSEDRYRMNNYGGQGRWDMGTRGGYADASEDLRQALTQNPHMKLMFVCGYYDLACPLGGTHYTVNHMDLGPDQMKRIRFNYYPAGHMVYIDKPSREKLHKDVVTFYQDALKD